MKKSIALLLVLVSLMAMLAIPAVAGAVVPYEVTFPSGHNTSGTKYPVTYLMPQDGYKANAEDKELAKLLANEGLDMVVVMPDFTGVTELHTAMDDLVKAVDADTSLHTIANAKQRAVAGIGNGGYLAYVLGMTDASGNVLTTPDLFASVASIRGNFVDESTNPWIKKYGSVYTKLSKNKSGFKKFFSYLDAPVDDEWSAQTGSTNDLGSLYIGEFPMQRITSDNFEFTVRPGKYNEAFMKESAKRITEKLSKWMVRYTFYTTMSSALVTSADEYAEIPYFVMGLPSGMLDGAIDQFLVNPWIDTIPMKITVSAYDTKTGEKLASSATATGYASYYGGSSGTLKIKNVADGETVALKMHAEALGTTFEIATGNMVFLKDPVVKGDYQEFDLMGDWYFKFTGSEKKTISDLLSSKEYESWDSVQPTLGWWAGGFGNIGSGYEVGNSYYVREFVLPEGFNTQNPVISVGYVDDCCEVYINGTRVGRTGYEADGSIDPDFVSWDKYSAFEFDPAILKHNGEVNTIVVTDYNKSGGGGWYAGPISLYSKKAFDEQQGGGSGFTERFYEESYYSDAVGAEMDYLIYLPKDYNTQKGDRYYPTLYLLHQFESTHMSYMGDGIYDLMEEAIDEGLIDQMIVVIPNSDNQSWWKGKWENMVIEDLIPHIDENYRTIKDARYRFTAGCSMGGQGAASMALTNPDFFSGMAGFYGAYDYGGFMGKLNPISFMKEENKEFLSKYALAFICGNYDSYGFGRGHITMHKNLDALGLDHYFFIENGDHSATFYVPYFKDTVSYTWKNMYDKKELGDAQLPNLRAMAYANLEKTEDGLTLIFNATEDIKKYFNKIPESTPNYTKNQTPALNIPLRITVTQNGKSYQTIIREHNLEQDGEMIVLTELTGDEFASKARSASGFDPSKSFTYKVEAAIFDNNWVELIRLPSDVLEGANLPDTGDHSSMMLYGLAFLASVAVLLVIGKRRNCIS